MRNINKTDFKEMLANAQVTSEYVQTGESEWEEGRAANYWGLVWRKIKINGDCEIVYYHEYEYQSDKPKSTLSIIPTDDPWDLGCGYDVIGENGEMLDNDELIAVILEVKPEIVDANASDLGELRDYPVAFDPVYKTYSLSVHNHEGPIGMASELREGGAVVLPKCIQELMTDSSMGWEKLTGGDAVQLNKIKGFISDALTSITTDGDGKGGVVCTDWAVKQIDKDLGFFIMMPDIDDSAYQCFNFNLDEHTVDKGMLGLIASIMGMVYYCREEGVLDADYGDELLMFCERVISNAGRDDRQAVELGDSMFSFTNNGLAYQVLSSMLRLPVYGRDCY